MDDLIAWLRVQLDEDDVVIARNRGEAGLGDSGSYPDYQTYDGPDIDAACDHLGRFPPPRMASEVEAKRRVLEWAQRRLDDAEDFPDDNDYKLQATEATVLHLRWLALPYADRPGYLPEWRPSPV